MVIMFVCRNTQSQYFRYCFGKESSHYFLQQFKIGVITGSKVTMFVWDRRSYFLSIWIAKHLCTHMWLEDLHTTNVIIYFTDAVPMSPYVREVAVIAIFILLSCVTLVRNKTLLINEYVHDDAIDILANTETWLHVNRRVSENRAFMH